MNRPRFDPRLGRVTEGYGILQPRVSVTMASAAGSLFARLYAGHTGVDPYTTAVSDTYQDLFGEGIFTGKGLYDVDAFMAALEGRVPENALLSHDLFEGLYARTALVTDVEVVDDYPASVLAHARRQHRWVRGDWQILLVAVPVGPDAARASRRNRLPLISRWKIFDNLRRSLVAPATVALLLLALDGRCREARRSGRPRSWPPLAFPLYPLLAGGRRRPAGRSSRGASSCARRAEDAKTALAQASPAAHVPGQPGLGEGARDRPDPRPPGGDPAPPAGVGDGRGQRGARGGRRSGRRARLFLVEMIASPVIALVGLAPGRGRAPGRARRGRCRSSRCGPPRRSSPTR